MRQSARLSCIVAAALILFACSKGEGPAVSDGGKAPDFLLSDITGKNFRLSEQRGKVVVVEFWATWCPPCRESIPELNAIYEKFRGRNFELLAISVDKGVDAGAMLNGFVKEHAIVYPVLVDNKDVNVLYGVSSIPVMFVIDKEGKVAKKHMGFSPAMAANISKEIETLL